MCCQCRSTLRAVWKTAGPTRRSKTSTVQCTCSEDWAGEQMYNFFFSKQNISFLQGIILFLNFSCLISRIQRILKDFRDLGSFYTLLYRDTAAPPPLPRGSAAVHWLILVFYLAVLSWEGEGEGSVVWIVTLQSIFFRFHLRIFVVTHQT